MHNKGIMIDKWRKRTLYIHQDVLVLIDDYLETYGIEMSTSLFMRFMMLYGDQCLSDERFIGDAAKAVEWLDDSYRYSEETDNLSIYESVSITSRNTFILEADSDYLYECLLTALFALDADLDVLQGAFWSPSLMLD